MGETSTEVVDLSEYVSRKDAAEFLGISEHAMGCRASSGTDPLTFRKVGQRVWYKVADLREYVRTMGTGNRRGGPRRQRLSNEVAERQQARTDKSVQEIDDVASFVKNMLASGVGAFSVTCRMPSVGEVTITRVRK